MYRWSILTRRNRAAVILRRCLNHAVKVKVIRSNPTEGLTLPKHEQRKMDVWSLEEQNQFLGSNKEQRLYPLLHTALSTGARQGELFALDWTDIDMAEATITISKSLEELCGDLRIKGTKTGRTRTIDIDANTVAVLNDHRKKMLSEGFIKSPVFCDTKGQWLRKSNVRRRVFLPAIERAGVKTITFHEMRHSHATTLMKANVPIKVISQRLGHKNVTTTLEIYAHVTESMGKEASQIIGQLLG